MKGLVWTSQITPPSPTVTIPNPSKISNSDRPSKKGWRKNQNSESQTQSLDKKEEEKQESQVSAVGAKVNPSPISKTDFDEVLARQRPTVSKLDLDVHERFTKEFGKAIKDIMTDAEARRGFIEEDEAQRVDKERSWADTPSDILCQIYSRLIAGERATFRLTCRSWNSVCGSVVVTSTQHQFQLPSYNNSECSSPCLLFLNNRIFHPIYDRCYHMDFLYVPGLTVHMAKDGWFLGKQNSGEILFLNPFTEEKVILPEIDSGCIESVYFSSAPTSADWFVILAVSSVMESYGIGIYTIKCGDDSWRSCKLSQKKEKHFSFSRCNPVVYKGLYYFLGRDAKLLIHDPKRRKFYFHKAPESISQLKCYSDWEKYMLESSDGGILAVFVGCDGTSVITLKWNLSEKKWETVESLGHKMVFVSRPQSLCLRATTMGTGNKIYFPRFVGASPHGLFYSLSTKRLHTFEMGQNFHQSFVGSKFRQSFVGSKFHLHATWWML